MAIIKDGRLVASGRSSSCAGRGRERSAWSSKATRLSVPGAAVVDRGPRGTVFDAPDPEAVLDAARAAGRVTYFALERPRLTDLFREAVR